MSSDTLKIQAAAFAARAGHGDVVTVAFVSELCHQGVLGRTEVYDGVLAVVVFRTRWGDTAWAALVKSQSGDGHLKLCDDALVEIQRQTRSRIARMIRAEFYLPGDGCSGLVKDIIDKIEPKG